MKQNTKANTTCQPVTKTETLNHENVSTKIIENVTQTSPNIDLCNNNSKTHEAINETRKKISIPSGLIGNMIGKNVCRVQQMQSMYNVKMCFFYFHDPLETHIVIFRFSNFIFCNLYIRHH